MKRRKASLMVVFLLVVGIFSVATVILSHNVVATALYVGGTGPGNHTTIQGAIDVAIDGDTIFVYSGVYLEVLTIDKMVSLIGENRTTSVIDGGNNPSVVTITSDWVNISGLTIMGLDQTFNGKVIDILFADNCTINDNVILDASHGIHLYYSNYTTAFDNNISDTSKGIRLERSQNGQFFGNHFNSVGRAIDLYMSHSNAFDSNTFSSPGTIVRMEFSYSNFVTNHKVPEESGGFVLSHSDRAVFMNNELVGPGISINQGSCWHWNGHVIDTSNTVNGKPVYYMKNATGGKVPSDAGEIILANSNGVTVEGFHFSDDLRILVGCSYNNLIANNTFSNTSFGIDLWESNSNLIVNNTFTQNSVGVHLHRSESNVVRNNSIESTHIGVKVGYQSHWNEIQGNNISSTDYNGIDIYYSNNLIIEDNFILSNEDRAIDHFHGEYSTILNNTMIGSGIDMDGDSLDKWNTHTIDTRNSVNGKPVYYWKDATGGVVPQGAGQVILANCENVLVENQNLSGATVGVTLGYSTNITIFNNTISDIREGITLRSSSWNLIDNNSISSYWEGIRITGGANNTIVRNDISLSEQGGIVLWSPYNNIQNNTIRDNDEGVEILSQYNLIVNNTIIGNEEGIWVDRSPNTIYHNTFLDNSHRHARSDQGNDAFDSGYPSGGNYWDDYGGIDDCSGPNQDVCPDPDGIGDTYYPVGDYFGIETAQDNYPLMTPLGGDKYPPRVWINSHFSGETVYGSPIALAGVAQDLGGSGVSHVEVRVNNSSWMTTTGTTSWSIDLDLNVGLNLIEVRAWDNVNNPSEIEVLDIIYSTLATVRGRVVSSDSNPIENADVELAKDDGTLTTMFVTDPSGLFIFSDIPSGIYTITITATGYGDFVVNDLTVPPGYNYLGDLVMTESGSYPTASFTVTPGTGSVDTVFNVDASSSHDPEDSISELEVRWDLENDSVWDTSWSTAKTALILYPSPGNYTIRLEVRDTDGLTDQTTRLVTVTLSVNQFPTCNITVIAGSSVSGIYRIQGTANDPDGSIERVEIRIDSGNWMPAIGTAHWTYDWDTTKEDNGAHTIFARSYDGEDNSSVANVWVVVDNPVPPTDDGSQDDWFWFALALLAVLTVVIMLTAYMFIRRREKSSEVEEPPEPPPQEPL
jgi:parallel beta-helix repeat protein